MAFLELKNIYKSYFLGKEEFPVLKGINLDFELGDFVSILGESGGGKSTLMNIIGGLDWAFKGEVVLAGQRLNHSKETSLNKYRRETVGYIYQSYNLIPHLNVLDNVSLALDMTTLSVNERKQRAFDLLKQVGLEDHVKKYPKQLSGGQKQRVAIARALANDPQVIIADEPTGALDSQNTEEVLTLLNQIAAEGRLVIAVTHSQHVADSGTRIVRLADGKIISDERLKPAYKAKVQRKLHSKKLPLLTSVRNAFKHFKYHFKRNLLIIIGTAVGLFSVITFNGLGTGVKGYVNQQVNSLVNPKQVLVTPYVKSNNKQQDTYVNLATRDKKISAFSKKDINTLKRVKDVTKVEKIYTLSNVAISFNKKDTNISTVTNWTSILNTSSIKKGRMPKIGEIVIDKKDVAKSLTNQPNSLIGKKITLTYTGLNKLGQKAVATVKVKVVGLTESSGTSQINAVGGSTIVDALKAVNMSTNVAALGVSAKSMNAAKSVAKRINEAKVNRKLRFTATAVSSILDRIETYISLITNVLAGIAGISLLVSALMIIVTMYMSVSDRTKEIGILRALGESKGDIRRLFTSESILLGIFSATFATIIALIVQTLANSALSKIAHYSFIQISAGNIISAFVISIIISLLAAILPARHAASLNPIDALAGE